MKGVHNNKEEIEKFFDSHIEYPKGGCMIWKGETSQKGFGVMRIGGAVFAARRIAFWIEYGHLPQGRYIKFKDVKICKNPLCCNVHHMEDATPTEERRDTLFKPGKSFNAPHIKPENVAAVWEQILLGETTHKEAAKKWGVSIKTLRKHLKNYESRL